MAESLDTRSVEQRLVSGGAWALFGRLGTAVAALVANVALARLLSPEELGVYFLAFSITMLGGLVGSLGLNHAVVRLVAESVGLKRSGRTRSVVRIVITLGLSGAVCSGLIYLFAGDLVGTALFQSPALVSVTGLVAGWIMVTAMQNIFAETFRGLHDIRLATSFGGLITGALLAGCFCLLWLLRGQATLNAVMLLAIGSGLANTLLAGWILRNKVGTLSPRDESGIGSSEVLRIALPLLVTNVALFGLTQADLWIVGAFRAQEEVAVYGAAFRLVAILVMPLLIVNAVVPPLIAEMYAQGRRGELERTLRTAATLASVPAVLLTALFVLLGGPILSLVFGDYYRAGAVILALLSFGHLMNVLSGSCGVTLMMTGHQNTMMGITVVSGILLVTGSVWAVQDYGASGVAGVTAISLTVQNAMMLLFARIKTGMWTHMLTRNFPS